MASKTFRFTGFVGGLYASSNVFDQPQGTVPRISNLILSERGGLKTVDGSHVITRPGPPPAAFGFVSSGAVTSAQPPAPVVPISPSVGFSFTGSSSLGGSPTLPLLLTLNIPLGVQVGDVLIALISVKGIFPGSGAHMNPIDALTGWTVLTYQTGVAQDSINILYRVVDGTEGLTVTFSYSGPAFNFAGFQMNGTIAPVRGANTIAPLDVFAFSANAANGSATSNSATTVHTNDLLLILMQPVNDNANAGGAGHITPGNIVGTTLQFNQQSPGSGALIDTLALWSKPFAGPGATGTFTSPTGWPLTQANQLVLALGAGIPPAGQLMGFPITANGVITPAPIIQGVNTALTAPQGSYRSNDGKLWVADAQSGNTGAIIGYTNPASAVGNVAPNVLIQGPNHSLLNGPYDVCVDSTGKIYVANYAPGSTGGILIYASGATGDATPTAQIGGGTTGLVHPRAVCVDASANVYVLDDTINSIKVWRAGNTGNVAPDQTITGALTQITNPLAIRVDPSGKVWITCAVTPAPTLAFLLKFNTTDNGNVAPTTRIDSTALQPQLGFAGPTGLAFDPAGDIFVAVLGNKNVLVFPVGTSGTANAPSQIISGFPNGPWGLGVQQV